ncbi:hypothetical protein B566_EDAN012160, partial [Ephemera danica]
MRSVRMKPSRSLLVLLLVFAVGGQSIQAQSTPSSRSCGTSSSEGAVPDTTVEYIKQFYMRGLAMYWAASLVYPRIKPLCLPPTATSTVNTQFDILVVGTSLHQKGTPPPESNAFVHEMSFVDLVSKEDCGRSRDDINLGTSHLCARGQASIEPCSSDRGAPLMNIVNNDHYVLFGSVSKISANCGDSGK